MKESMLTLTEFVQLCEDLNDIPEITDEQIEAAESYHFETDVDTGRITTTLYDEKGDAIVSYELDDFDVAVALLQGIGFDLDDLNQYDYDNDTDEDNPLDYDNDGIAQI